MNLKKVVTTLFFTFVVLQAALVHAFEVHFSDLNLTQVRKSRGAGREVPLVNYLNLGFDAPEKKLSFKTNMQGSYDFEKKNKDYDLYDAALTINNLWDVLTINAGRLFLDEGFGVYMVDGLNFDITPKGPVAVNLFGGVNRSVERGDFNVKDGLYSGLNLHLKDVSRTDASVGVAWNKQDIRRTDNRENDMILARASASHGFLINNFNPYVYGLIEYIVTGKVVNTATVGTVFYPHWRVTIDIEGSYDNDDRSFREPTLLSIYSTGGMYQGRAGLNVKLVEEISFVSGYSYQQYKPPARGTERGNVVDAGFKGKFDGIGLTAHAIYSLKKSFGGQDNSVSAGVSEDFTDRLYAFAEATYSSFKKITNDNGWALSTAALAGYEVVKGLLLSSSFEYIKNDIFNYDIRGTVGISYSFHKPSKKITVGFANAKI